MLMPLIHWVANESLKVREKGILVHLLKLRLALYVSTQVCRISQLRTPTQAG